MASDSVAAAAADSVGSSDSAESVGSPDAAGWADPADSDRAEAPVRLLALLGSARPADVPAVLAALPEGDLALGVEAAQGRLALPVREYILTEGPNSARVALARATAVVGGVGSVNTVDRLLTLCDPDVDAVFFDVDPARALVSGARQAVLRDRKGPDGHAVIPPSVKQQLLAAVARPGPSARLLTEVAAADDPDLVLAVVPYAKKLPGTDAARIMHTLDTHGRRREAKRQRALWARRGSDFALLGFPRFGHLLERFALGTSFEVRASDDVTAISLDRFRELVEQRQYTDHHRFRKLHEAAQVALRTGTITPAEMLEHARPAALGFALALCDEEAAAAPGLRRACDDMLTLIARHATEQLGDDVKRWARAIAWAGYHGGTVLEFLADRDLTPGRPINKVEYAAFNPTEFSPANILLALAPPDVATAALVTKRMKKSITAAARGLPLCRALVEFVVEHGTVPQRGLLAANEATPDSVLLRLLAKPKNDEVMASIRERELVGPQIGKAAFVGVPRDQKLLDWIIDHAATDPVLALNAIRGTSEDPAWVLDALRATVDVFREEGQAAAYVLLAEVAGVEAVWALELDRVGSLDYIADQVRESMATGDAAPLIAEAEAHPVLDTIAAYYAEPLRTEAALDQPPTDPMTRLIRSRLDGRPDRWLALAGKLRERPQASDAELVGEFSELRPGY
ncbi:hypothetical protein KGQ20_09315 [Catenulispora sp. NF23]|uniref:hypothetical protein n=1 Tax=Catenulispora pinistramenti TaxID=2705254 RepID=UPI001BADAFC4|nr:hypothetical protein [Catenulispora pinistramenti]MBS2532973.1 hypothetical protein [Catenulispora pinistramenti]